MSKTLNVGEFKRQLAILGPTQFVETRLFDDNTWYFPIRSGVEYEDVRILFGELFKVESENVALVGSGKYGFSLAPAKEFRSFQADDTLPDPSDIDLVIVSRAIFNDTWHQLRRADYNGAVDARRFYQEDIFRRFIMIGTNEAFDTRYLKSLSVLLNSVRRLATTRVGIIQTIKLRVYCSWTDAKAYHIWSLQRLGEKHGI